MPTKNKILLIEKNEKLYNLITDNIPDVSIEISKSDNAINKLINAPTEFDLIIITLNIDKKVKLNLIKQILSDNTLKFLNIIVEIPELNVQERTDYIASGARYCFTLKDKEFTLSVIKKALLDSQKLKNILQEIALAKNMEKATFKIKTLEEAHALADFLSQVCENQKYALMGITELLINAIEHGNLSMSYEEKTKASVSKNWLELIAEKQTLPENINKYVTVEYIKNNKNKEITIKITDEGQGFDWRKFQNLDNKRKLDTHGRGIFLAKNLAFTSLEYIGKGNTAIAKLKIKAAFTL